MIDRLIHLSMPVWIMAICGSVVFTWFRVRILRNQWFYDLRLTIRRVKSGENDIPDLIEFLKTAELQHNKKGKPL